MKRILFVCAVASFFGFSSCDSPAEERGEGGDERVEEFEDAAEERADEMQELQEEYDTTAVIE